ncbi:MAG: ferrous iron transport protein A [Desulfurococcaceae archaeon]
MLALQNATSLDLVKSGSRAVVKEILHKGGIARRLYYMGLTPGTELEVVANNGYGPVVVRIRDIEVSLGRGIARSILVEVIKE